MNYDTFIKDNGLFYSIDMVRLSTKISLFEWSRLEALLDIVKGSKKYSQRKVGTYLYNYILSDFFDNTYWIGYYPFTPKECDPNSKKTLTIEFNPNKVAYDSIFNNILFGLLQRYDFKLIKFDLAIDIPRNILDFGLLYKNRKRIFKCFSNGGDDLTYYLGKGKNAIKIYNKKRESNLDYDLTRYEITGKTDFSISSNLNFEYDFCFVDLECGAYQLGLMEDKTLLGLAFAVNCGYDKKNLTRTYKNKLEKLARSSTSYHFSNEIACKVVQMFVDKLKKIRLKSHISNKAI